MVTIQDVARRAGVSAMTVSNVINDRPNVKPSTRDRVLRAIVELEYRVNHAARNLRAGRTGTIGLAVPEVDRPYFGQLAARIIARGEELGYRVVIEQTGASRENELSAIGMSRNRMYDGLILSTVGLGGDDVDLLRVDFPLVLLGERIFDGPIDHVGMDNVAGAAAATRHLIERGSRRIAFVSGTDLAGTNVASLRYTGYRAALTEAGVLNDPALVFPLDAFTLEAGAEMGMRIARSGVGADAVFCVTDTVAMGVLRGLRDAGARVPEEIRVIGFDDIEEARFLSPRLSSVDPGHDLMAARAVEFLVDRLRGEGDPSPRELLSATRVVARESTD